MPKLTGQARKTAADILTIWPAATMVVDGSYGSLVFAVLQQWQDALLDQPPTPSEEELADLEMSEEAWHEYQYNEHRLPLHLVTDEWMPMEIAERFGVPDNGFGLDYWPAEYLYPIERQEEIEQALRDLGFTVVGSSIGSDGAFLERWLS
ncbi:hypothetical protein [Planomonospora algeriensis]